MVFCCFHCCLQGCLFCIFGKPYYTRRECKNKNLFECYHDCRMQATKAILIFCLHISPLTSVAFPLVSVPLFLPWQIWSPLPSFWSCLCFVAAYLCFHQAIVSCDKTNYSIWGARANITFLKWAGCQNWPKKLCISLTHYLAWICFDSSLIFFSAARIFSSASALAYKQYVSL